MKLHSYSNTYSYYDFSDNGWIDKLLFSFTKYVLNKDPYTTRRFIKQNYWSSCIWFVYCHEIIDQCKYTKYRATVLYGQGASKPKYGHYKTFIQRIELN